MPLKPITEGLPEDFAIQLTPSETVYYFSFIALIGGCNGKGKKENHWIGITDKSIVFKTKVMDGKKLFEKEAKIPFEKIGLIELSESQDANGCRLTKGFQIRIRTPSATLIIPLPTKEKCYEIRKAYAILNQS